MLRERIYIKLYGVLHHYPVVRRPCRPVVAIFLSLCRVLRRGLPVVWTCVLEIPLKEFFVTVLFLLGRQRGE